MGGNNKIGSHISELSIPELWIIVTRRKWMIIWITLISVITSALISYFVVTPKYESYVRIVVVKDEARAFFDDKYTDSDILMFQRLMKTYAEIAMSKSILQKTTDNLQKYSASEIKILNN